MIITANSYFSGAGLFDYGLSLSGIHVQRHYEIDQTCVETLRKNFNVQVSPVDITKQVGNGVPVTIGQWVGEELTRYFNL